MKASAFTSRLSGVQYVLIPVFCWPRSFPSSGRECISTKALTGLAEAKRSSAWDFLVALATTIIYAYFCADRRKQSWIRPVRMITTPSSLRVRETARIDEVAAGYLTLRRSGKDLVASSARSTTSVTLVPGSARRSISEKCFQLRAGGGPHTPLAPHGVGWWLRGGRAAAGPQVWSSRVKESEEQGAPKRPDGTRHDRRFLSCGNEAFARLPPFPSTDPARVANGRGRERRGRPQGAPRGLFLTSVVGSARPTPPRASGASGGGLSPGKDHRGGR